MPVGGRVFGGLAVLAWFAADRNALLTTYAWITTAAQFVHSNSGLTSFVLAIVATFAVVPSVGHVAIAANVETGVSLLQLAAASTDEIPKEKPSKAVRDIQSALSELGYYSGAINGRLDRETQSAIRLYQSRVGIEVTGLPSPELLKHLRFVDEVQALQTRLAEVRETQIADARAALSDNPATRGLAQREDVPVADPTRDPSECFNEPTPACLLGEALESARAINRVQFRDWVLGEILTSQARAGFSLDALSTLRLVQDPRLVIVGLRNISRAQATAGMLDEARETASIIPLSWSRAEAFAAIAPVEAQSGAHAAVQATVRRVLDLVNEPTDIRRRVATLGTLAVALAGAGDRVTAKRVIERARDLVAQSSDGEAKREALLSEIATALADLGDLDEVSRLLGQIDDTRHHPPVMLAAAKAYLRDGRDEEALETAIAVPEERYRVVALGRVAVAQYQAGDKKRAVKTLERALEAADEIDPRATYARAYAVSQVVHAFIAIDAFTNAARTAGGVRDPRLQSDAYWSIAAAQARSGFAQGAKKNFGRAKRSLADVQSPLDRSWIMSNLVVGQIREEDYPAAKRALNRAVEITRDITSPWARAQAIAKLAGSLIALEAVQPQVSK